MWSQHFSCSFTLKARSQRKSRPAHTQPDTHTDTHTHSDVCFVMGSTSYKLICMSMKWHFNATLYFHYCCCFVAIVGAIEELEVHGEGDAGNAQGMGCEMRTGSWDLKLVSSNELRFVATCKTHLFWHEAHKSIFDPFRSSFFSFVFCIHTDDAKQKGVKSFPWPRNPTPTPCVPWFVLVIWH